MNEMNASEKRAEAQGKIMQQDQERARRQNLKYFSEISDLRNQLQTAHDRGKDVTQVSSLSDLTSKLFMTVELAFFAVDGSATESSRRIERAHVQRCKTGC
jgi:hypothetical protein